MFKEFKKMVLFSFLLCFIQILFLILLVPNSYCYGSPIRIMPLGDSITEGKTATITDPNYIVGYRQKLFRSLQDAGYSVDFVGSEHAGSLAFPPFDPDHEGHPGWTAAQVASNVNSWLAVNPPDIVLLHVGTNDVELTNISDIEFLLNEIDRYSKDIVVLLARIVNRQTFSAATTTFNDNVEAMAMARIANGDKIIMVDQEGALLYPYDITDDNLHPTPGGYEKMADTWFAALEGVLPTTNGLPRLAFSGDTKHFRMTQGEYPLTQSVTLDALDGVPGGFTVTSGASWLDASPAGGTTPTTVTLSINDRTLPVGLYSTYVTASSPGYVDAVLEITLVVVTPNSSYQLLVSSLPNHSNPFSLQNANLTGEVYVFTSPDSDVSKVSFYLDHQLYRVENFAPFDFEGGNAYNTIQLTNEQHEITAIISHPNGQSEVISSSFSVNSLLSALNFNTSSISFGSEEGILPLAQVVDIDSSDSTAADFTVVANVDWLTLSPTTGTTPVAVTVSVNDSTLAPGIYTATITAVADGYTNATVTVNYSVTNPGGSVYNLLLSSSPNRSGAVVLDGAIASGNIYVFTDPDNGVKGVTFSLDGTVVKTEGLAPFDFAGTGDVAEIALPYATSQLSDGQHEISALINLTGGGSELVSGTFTINNNIPALSVDTGNILFQALQGELPQERAINLNTSDFTVANYTISTNVSWLTVYPVSGTTPAAVTVSVNDSTLTPGIYTATITAVADGYTNATVTVSYSVTKPGGSVYNLLLSSSPDRSGAVVLDGAIASGNIYVFTDPDNGVKGVTFSLDGTVVRTEGLAPFDFAGSGDMVEIALPYATSQLSDGQHEISALINLTGGGSELVSGTFMVNNNGPALLADIGNIPFQALQGELPQPQMINLSTTDSIMANYTISPDVNWLTVSPPNGTTPAAVTVSVNDSTLAPGIYTATITAVAGGYTNATVTVSYIVTNPSGSAYNLFLSLSPNRSGAVVLDGTNVSGNIYVFTSPDNGVKGVTFSLDGIAVKTEGLAPFDFAGTGMDIGVAYPYATSQLTNGQHEISALINLTGGGSELITSIFTVLN